MQKKNIVYSIVIALGLVALVFIRMGKAPASPAVSNSVKPQSAVVQTQVKRPQFNLKEDLPNPMNQPKELVPLEPNQGASAAATSAKDTPPLTLQGIVWDGRHNLAVIGGVVVAEGESVGGVKVIAIDRDSVKLLENGVEITLKR